MSIKALCRIKAGNVIYEPGSVITGLEPSEEEKLIELKVAVRIEEEKLNIEKNDQSTKKKRK